MISFIKVQTLNSSKIRSKSIIFHNLKNDYPRKKRLLLHFFLYKFKHGCCKRNSVTIHISVISIRILASLTGGEEGREGKGRVVFERNNLADVSTDK